jgi:hypothetical protein
MKKFCLVVAAALMAANVFVACSDDNEPAKVTGTSWSYTDAATGNVTRIKFTTASECIYSDVYQDAPRTLNGTYEQTWATIVIPLQGIAITFVGEVNGDNLNITSPATMTLTKE